MTDKICLDINNFGPIKNANLDIKKLNIIAGINGSGKSTSSKLLYTFLLASSKKGDYLANKSIYDRFEALIFNFYRRISMGSKDIHLEELLKLCDDINLEDNFFNETLKNKLGTLLKRINESEFPDKEKIIDELNNIENLIKFNEDQQHKYFNVTNVLLNSEFNFSELNGYQDANVHIHGDINDCEFSYKINFKRDKLGAEISNDCFGCLNFDEVIYMESPSIFELNNSYLNNIYPNKIPYHLQHLHELVSSEKDSTDVFDKEYNHRIVLFQEKLAKLLNGQVYYNSIKNDFIFRQEDGEYSLKNTASGVKQIGILQILLENRFLREDSFLFIDEPEINIHPEWQVKLAEILVLMVKELNIRVYINSHSPQFIEAIEVYSGKHGLVDESTFYLSVITDNNFTFKEILRENLSELYDNLGNPYDVLDEIRAENIAKGIF